MPLELWFPKVLLRAVLTRGESNARRHVRSTHEADREGKCGRRTVWLARLALKIERRECLQSNRREARKIGARVVGSKH